MTDSLENKDNWTPVSRRWIHVGDSCDDEISFSAITYNILNDVYVIDSPSYAVYLKEETEFLKFSRPRNARILKELASWNPDVVALQEMRRDLYSSQWLPEMASRGYSGLLTTPRYLGHNGVALFFRNDLFELQRAVCEPFEDLMNSCFSPRGEAESELQLLRHPRAPEYCAIIVKLLHRPSGRSVVMASFHLTWEEFEAPVFKSLQVAALVHHAERMASETSGLPCPLLLLGDLNATPEQMTYHMLAEDKWSADVLDGPEVSRQHDVLAKFVEASCHLPKGLKLNSCYKEATNREPHITSLTNEGGVFRGDCLDYIWRSEGRGLLLKSVMSECNESDLREFSALPSPRFPSDHVPVMARFRLGGSSL